MNKGFITQTAFDYDLDYSIVERVYRKYLVDDKLNTIEFYEELEYIIKHRTL